MGIYYTDLISVLEAAGVQCGVNSQNAGWETRARSSGGFPSPPKGIVWHHTASKTSIESDLAWQCHNCDDAPVGNMTIARDGVVWPVAAGASNCAGKGGPANFSRGQVAKDSGNTGCWNIEVANNGVGEPWPVAQIDAYFKTSNALNTHFGNQVSDVITHQAWAPDRKIDPATAAAVQGPWRPGSINSSGTWNLNDIINECLGRVHWEDDDMPTAQEVAEAVWAYAVHNHISNEAVQAGTILGGAHAEAYWAKVAAQAVQPQVADLHYYELENAGYSDKPDKPADFWNGIRESVRQQVEAVLRENGVIQ